MAITAATTPTTVSSAASELLKGAQSVSEMVYSLPNEDFIVTHGLTSNGKGRIILESVNDQTKGAINLFHNVDPDLLNALIPQDVYLAGSLDLLFKPSASAGSESCYNFQFYPSQEVANKLLTMKNQTAQAMIFPAKKEQLNGAEASLATSINRGNKGRAMVEATKVGMKDGTLAGFFKSMLG